MYRSDAQGGIKPWRGPLTGALFVFPDYSDFAARTPNTWCAELSVRKHPSREIGAQQISEPLPDGNMCGRSLPPIDTGLAELSIDRDAGGRFWRNVVSDSFSGQLDYVHG